MVHWSNQRHVKVSDDTAGNTWAPEAYYDDEISKYVVYWASNLYESADQSARTSLTYNRMMYATTDDFINFSKPHVWIDVDRRGQAGAGSIDATVQKVGDTYYRVYKDEKSMTLRQEKPTDLLASVNGQYPSFGGVSTENQWSLVGERIGDKQPNGYGGTFTAGEGPTMFKANKNDVNGYQYYLFADQPNYHGGPNHYVPMATKNITDASSWEVIGEKMPEANFPTNSDGGKPRHGTIIPVTREQYQKVLEAYAPSVAVTRVPRVSVQVSVGADIVAALPSAVAIMTKDKKTHKVAVQWNVPAGVSSKVRTVEVTGTIQDDSRMPITARVKVRKGK
ncbi:Ig-like domain-containing protein [Alloscardovia venturai]|uniref:Ig-like domain-containing protein n=1 Tax=Alloscardovia venturai TaxID=1769421 RepID=A0ABW2Y306_9BIFI